MEPKTFTFTVSLDTPAYRRALYWNFFCKNKRSTFLILFLFGGGFFTISYSLLLYQTNSAMFLVTMVPAFLCLILPLYFVYQLERQIKAKSSSTSMDNATKKEVCIDDHSLSILQAASQISSEYTWHSVKGVYPTGNGLMLCMNDGQIIVMLEDQTSPDKIEYVKKLASQNKCLKNGLSPKTVAGAFLLLSFAGLYLILKSAAG